MLFLRTGSRWRRLAVALLALVTATVVYATVSLTVFVLRQSADPFQQNVATWARDHRLGFVVNRLERWVHADPPSARPASSLALEGVAGTALPPSTSAVIDTVGPSSSPAPATSTPVSAAPTTSVPAGPVSLAPALQPSLDGEGVWRVLASIGASPVVWGTSIRPLVEYGSVVATAAVLDSSRLHAALFNGSEIPGKGPWKNGSRITQGALPALVAAFNGGFRLEHIRGGYVTEGRTVRRLRNGEATLAIDRDGRLALGVWGKDLTDDGSWASVRQNLPPVVMDGVVSVKKFPGTYWGDDFHRVTFTYRSAICTRRDGLLMYVAIGDVDIMLLGRALVVMGCITAMQLDINGNWPQFDTYGGFGQDKRVPALLDRRMSNASRYLRRSSKDFIALFDPATLRDGVLG
uniref:Unannotated protein n=1 Tax=freshwater metagenome TaxID=449393 RepID=A0A6J7PEV1_9ZZZZ